MKKATASATLALALTWSGFAFAEAYRQPTYFLDGTRNPALIAAIRKGMDAKVTFNGHFSSAYVPCGPGCDSYWFVDRKTGGVVEVPEGPGDDQMIWDVRALPGSDTIAVTYGSRDGAPAKCFARHFRWGGKSFVSLDKPLPAKCPA